MIVDGLLGRKLQGDNLAGIRDLLKAVGAEERKHVQQTPPTHNKQLETDILNEKDHEDQAITTIIPIQVVCKSCWTLIATGSSIIGHRTQTGFHRPMFYNKK